jgi:hypothetical protein
MLANLFEGEQIESWLLIFTSFLNDFLVRTHLLEESLCSAKLLLKLPLDPEIPDWRSPLPAVLMSPPQSNFSPKTKGFREDETIGVCIMDASDYSAEVILATEVAYSDASLVPGLLNDF